jgi:hypothetical protein
VHKWDKNENIGKKYCISNAFIKSRRTRAFDFTIPAYDLYKETFNACDAYNRKLHDRVWPFRYGGKTRSGEFGLQHKFAFGVILENTFAVAYHQITGGDPNILSFQEKCFRLADALYTKSVAL